jgi:glycosyltransferase involved in cell wall biosynthesis
VKICIVCHYFWPEISAPSARLKEMAEAWIAAGHEVTAVTNFPNHPTGEIQPAYRGKDFMEERVDGIRILRCRTYATPNTGILRKTLGHLVFAWNVTRQAARHLAGTDVVLVSSPTLFSAVGALRLSRRLGCPCVLEVRDLWPAIFVELGVLENPLLIRALEQLELFLYRRSRRVVAVTQAFADDIAARGIPREKLAVIRNGVDLSRFEPGPKSADVAREFGVEGRFVVLYIGAHGISHGLGAVLEAARLLEHEQDVHFLFVGEGAEKEALVARAREMKLRNASFHPAQPRDRVPDLYRLADVCLVPLRNIPLFRTFIPSKMFEIMGTGRPIVAAVEGEAAEILTESRAAKIAPPEDARAIADAILELKKDPAAREALARNGREFVSQHYDRRELARRYVEILAGAAGAP